MRPASPTDSDLANLLARLETVEAALGIGHDDGRPLDENDPPPSPEHDRRLPAVAVAKRYGVTVRTVDRWLDKPALQFPKPEVVNNRRYWSLAKLRGWDRARIRQSMNKAPEVV